LLPTTTLYNNNDHITDALASLHWLRVLEHIAVLVYTFLHGTALRYLGLLVCVSDLPGRRCLRSASTDHLVVPSFKPLTIGSRTFKVAAAQTWNGLPEDVCSLLNSTPALLLLLVPRIVEIKRDMLKKICNRRVVKKRFETDKFNNADDDIYDKHK